MKWIRSHIHLLVILGLASLLTFCAIWSLRTGSLGPVALFRDQPECRELARKAEGSHYQDLPKISCSLGNPQTIANSTLTARTYTYSQRDNFSECSGIDPGFSPYCGSAGGLITSDGRLYSGLNYPYSFEPGQYDYCATEEAQQWGSREITPAKHDLYIYNGKLYQRITYQGEGLSFIYGKCSLTGTALIDGDSNIITNIQVTYTPAVSTDFLTNCETTTLHTTGNEWNDCILFMAAAQERFDICANDYQSLPFYTGSDSITRFQTLNQVDHRDGIDPKCKEAYLQRAAAQQHCNAVTDVDMRKTCNTYVTEPESDHNPFKITRVFGSL